MIPQHLLYAATFNYHSVANLLLSLGKNKCTKIGQHLASLFMEALLKDQSSLTSGLETQDHTARSQNWT